ncbi:MAG: iron-containing alcohol dehydrogenase [Caldilinea sp.]
MNPSNRIHCISDYTVDRHPAILVGSGALNRLPDHVRRLGAAQVLLVSDHGMAAAGWVGRVESILAGQCAVETFLAPPGEPRIATIDEGAAIARALGSDCAVVGLGGGTALDIAKLIAAVSVDSRPMRDYMMCANLYGGKLPSIMAPSTSGTGAEVTRTCVLADEQGRKSWAWGDELRPDLAILDPAVTVTLPPALTAATGLDALVHAVEAATAQRANPIAQSFALQAVRLIADALPVAVAESHNLGARQKMQEAACLAGMAIDQCGTGIAHNIGHALGTVAHLPHAVAVAVAMQCTLAWSVEADPARYQPVADAMRPGAAGVDLPHLYEDLLAAADFAEAAKPFGGREIDPAALLASMHSPENQPMLVNNARIPTHEEMELFPIPLIHQIRGLSLFHPCRHRG